MADEPDERGEAERYNDEHIAPKLAAIAAECKEHGLYIAARVEWASFEGQTTSQRSGEGRISPSHEMVYLASMTNGNLDAMLFSLARAHSDGLLDLSPSMVAHWLKLEPFVPQSKRSKQADGQ